MSAGAKRAAVIGAGLGGLSAAIHLRLAGFDVTVYERNDQVGGRAGQLEMEGFRFDTGPTLLNYPWVFEELFAAAGARLSEHVELLAVDPTVRFIWPDGEELTLSSDLPTLAREFERLEPGSLSALTAFLADAELKYGIAMRKLGVRNASGAIQWLRGAGLRELLHTSMWRSMRSELRRFFRSPRILDALGSYAMYLGGSPWRLPGILTILPYGEIAYGLWMPRGGIYSLVRAVERLAVSLGARIVTGAEVQRIVVADGRVCGVELSDGTEERWPTVISNVDVPTTRRELLTPPSAERPPEMTPGVLTCYMGLRGRPDGLGHHTIFLPFDSRASFDALFDEQRVPEEPAFYACAPSATDPDLAPPGCSTLYLLTPVPLIDRLPQAPDPAWPAGLRDRMIARMERHGIAIPPEQRACETMWTPHDWQRRYRLYNGSAFGASHRLGQMGPWRCPNRDRKIGGLYYVGASTTPGTGMPTVVLGGRMTAERVIADAH